MFLTCLSMSLFSIVSIEPNTEIFIGLKSLYSMKVKFIKKSNTLLILMISMKDEF